MIGSVAEWARRRGRSRRQARPPRPTAARRQPGSPRAGPKTGPETMYVYLAFVCDKLINSVIESSTDRYEFIKANPDKVVKITLSRNIPEDVISKIEIAKGMTEIGLSKESIIDFIPIIDDTAEELERIVKEAEEAQKRFDESFQEPEEKDPEETGEDLKDEEG